LYDKFKEGREDNDENAKGDKEDNSVYKQINIISFSEEHSYRVFEYWGVENVYASGPQ